MSTAIAAAFPRALRRRYMHTPLDERRSVAMTIRDRWPNRFWLTVNRLSLLDLTVATGDLTQITVGAFKAAAAHAGYYEIQDEEGNTRACDIPARVLADVYHDQTFFRPLDGVVRCPWVAKDGRRVVLRGYDDESRTWLHWSVDQDQPVRPPKSVSDDDRDDVLRRLLDFNFESEVDRAAALAMFVQAVRGPAAYGFARPLNIICAAAMESGKTYLLDLVGLLINGRRVSSTILPSTEEELFYSLPALLGSGEPLIAFDNVKTGSRLDSAILQSYLTASGPVSSRQVRTSKAAAFDPTRTIWVLSTNQPDVDAETGRRSVLIRLRPKTSPHVTEDLKSWVLENRGRIVAVLHRLVCDWIEAGSPMPVAPIPSFEKWSVHVLAPVLHHMPEAATQWATQAQPVPKEDREWARLFGDVWPKEPNGEPKLLQAKEALALVDGADVYTLQREVSRRGGNSDKARVTAFGCMLTSIAERSAVRPVLGWSLRVIPRARGGKVTRYVPHLAHLGQKGAGPKALEGGGSPHLPHLPHLSDDVHHESGTRGGESNRVGVTPAEGAGRCGIDASTYTIGSAPFLGGAETEAEVRELGDDPYRAEIEAVAGRGIRIDVDAWRAAWDRAEEDLGGREDQRSLDRLRTLRSYAPEVYAQAEVGRVRATACLQPTGRIGFVGPTLQNITKGYGLRDAVIPAPDHIFIVADWRSAHMWIAAGVARDDALLADLSSGDAYRGWGAPWLPDGNEATQRALGKALALSIINGAGPRNLLETAAEGGSTVDVGAAAALRKAWLNRYPALRDLVRDVQRAGHGTTPSGRTVQPPEDRRHATPAWVWQAVEADALRMVLRKLDQEGVPVVLTLHDEVICEVPEDRAEAAAALVKTWMELALLTQARLPDGCDVVRVDVRGSWGKTASWRGEA